VQDITNVATGFTLERGLWRGLGLELTGFYRHVVARIQFEDEQRQPLDWPQGDIHHRNETLNGLGDPWLLLHGARAAGSWTLSARAGASLLGRTEPNPFALGREAFPPAHPVRHRHGGPHAGPGSGPPLQRHHAEAVRWAGSRWPPTATATAAATASWWCSSPRASWRPSGSPAPAFSWPARTRETWDGRIEEEGNLGRTDVLLALALTRGAAAPLTLGVQIPALHARTGAQLDCPVILSLGVSR
jgi:hypothetical protein